MKYRDILTCGALVAAALVAGAVQATNTMSSVVFCKATIVEAIDGGDAANVSVTLPFTSTSPSGLQYTYWNVGDVPPGGVADSWHAEGGPGRFVARNSGRVGAYIYLTSSPFQYAAYWDGGRNLGYAGEMDELDDSIYEEVYGYYDYGEPTTSLDFWRKSEWSYCLAFTRDVTAKAPTWHLLDRYYDDSWRQWRQCSGSEEYVDYIGAYMGYLDAGDYMPFDVKFWAPRSNGRGTYDFIFTFKVEAASFPLWEHEPDVR